MCEETFFNFLVDCTVNRPTRSSEACETYRKDSVWRTTGRALANAWTKSTRRATQTFKVATRPVGRVYTIM